MDSASAPPTALETVATVLSEDEPILDGGVKVEALSGSQINVMNLKKMHYFY